MPKKIKKKIAKKTKKASKGTVKKKVVKKVLKLKPIGRVTHFFGKIKVAIVKFNKKVPVGKTLHFKGATTDFKDVIKSMQYEHKSIKSAPKGKQVGIKVKRQVREGDEVYGVS